MKRRTAVGIWALVMMMAVVGLSCGQATERERLPVPTGSRSGIESPSVMESPSTTQSMSPARAVQLRTNGLGLARFGEPMVDIFPLLVEILGPPVDEIRMHGDMPYGYGDMDSTVRRVDFGGLYAVFGDWDTHYRDDGVMHLAGWGASERRTANGTVLSTPEGIAVGASVADLEEALGPSLDLSVHEGCTGPPWYFVAGSGLVVNLTGSPSDPGSRLAALSARVQREGWAPSCLE